MNRALRTWTRAYFWSGQAGEGPSLVRVWSPGPFPPDFPDAYEIDFHREHTTPGPPAVAEHIRKAARSGAEWRLFSRDTRGRRVIFLMAGERRHAYEWDPEYRRWDRLDRTDTWHEHIQWHVLFPELVFREPDEAR